MAFIRVNELYQELSVRGLDAECVARAMEERLLPTYGYGDTILVWDGDLGGLPVSWTPVAAPGRLPFPATEGAGQRLEPTWSRLRFANGVEVLLPAKLPTAIGSAVGPALRVLAKLDGSALSGAKHEMEWVGGSRVSLPASAVDIAKSMALRVARVSSDHVSELTKSAYYMGSKFSLASFLVEGLASSLPSDGVVVDLMCGAGAATRAFSLNWDVLACDAMAFGTCLSAGFGDKRRAADVIAEIPRLHVRFKENLEQIEALARELLLEEEELLHSSLGFEELRTVYAGFVGATPRYPEGGTRGRWDPVHEAVRRQGSPFELPYCLSLAYFGNVYFGVRQAAELDSLRYAIDGISDPSMRNTALAAAVATASYVGTGYASQFAQPVNVGALKRGALFDLLERRAIRVFPEFVARMSAMAEEAEQSDHLVSPFTGTWEESLLQVAQFAGSRPACIYLDAPYTRDEYSRYYHVLETLCRYRYPDSSGRGRVPSRASGHLFRSPFFTRSDRTIVPLLSRIILESLRRAQFCAWSYSSRARASVPEVIQSVVEGGGHVRETFSARHRYNSQGRTDRRRSGAGVDEYLILFERGTLDAASSALVRGVSACEP